MGADIRMSSNGRCFDVGNATYDALERFETTGDPIVGSTDPYSAGNGCIMRLAPVPMFFHADREAVLMRSADSSRTTHGAPECLDASRLFGAILHQALSGTNKESIVFAHGADGLTTENVQAIARGDWRDKSEKEIKGSGYVVRSLEAALWCFLHTDSFEAAVL